MAKRTQRRDPRQKSAARQREVASQRAGARRARRLRLGIGVAAVLAAGAIAFVLASGGGDGDDRPSETPQLPAGAETFGDLALNHVEGTVAYEQTPPVGGPHAGVWQNCGVYTEPVPNERAVHSLEHGAIWITYRPDLPADDIAELAALADDVEKLLVSPYPDLDAPLVMTAWGVRLELESITDPRIEQFIGTVRAASEAPEPNGPCTDGAGEPS